MILDPNGMPILQPAVDNAETATFNTAFAAVGTAFSGFTGTREIQTFVWADNAARTAQTGMTAGDEGYQTDTDTGYRYDGAAWNEVVSETHLQLGTTNSVAKMVPQYGMGKITGNGADNMNDTVTFPVAFTTIPFVQANMLGNKATGGFPNPVSELTFDTQTLANGQLPTTTTMVVQYRRLSGTFSSSFDYYYSWAATGVLA